MSPLKDPTSIPVTRGYASTIRNQYLKVGSEPGGQQSLCLNGELAQL